MKKVKLTDVAKAAGVSTATVSRVLNNNGYVSGEVRLSVWNAVRSTGYGKGPGEDHPSRQKLVGVILKKLPVNMFFVSVNYALQNELEKADMQPITIFCDHVNNNTVKERTKKLLDYHVCGLIISGFEDDVLTKEVRSLLSECGIPVVFVERLADSQGFNRICVDNTRGGYLAARHLIEKRQRKIVYISRGKTDYHAGSYRLEGFMKAIREEKQPPEYLIKTCSSPDVSEGYRALKEAEQELPGFTGVQAWYDGYVVGALQYLYEKGLRVPDDIEVIGHDSTYSALLAPPVSSVCLPFEEMAAAAVNVIVEWQDESVEHFVKSVYLEPKLILR